MRVIGCVLRRHAPITGHRNAGLGSRYKDHQPINLGVIDSQNAGSAPVSRQLAGGDPSAERADAESGAFGCVGEGLEPAAVH